MKIEIIKRRPQALDCDMLIIPLFSDTKRPSEVFIEIDEVLHGALQQAVQYDQFVAKLGVSLILPTLGHLPAKKIVLLGLGEKKGIKADTWRKAGAYLVKLASQQKAKQIVCSFLPVEAQGFSQAIESLTEGAYLSAYRFHIYHGRLRKMETERQSVERLGVCISTDKEKRLASDAIERSRTLTEATCVARDLVNTTSQHLAPKQMVEAAKQVVGKNIELHVMDKKHMEELGMGAALSVSAGSIEEPYGVHLTYKNRKAKKRIAIVGKAVTFDSGGLSLKPAEAMMGMKMDMSGGATVIGIFKALSAMKLNVEVHGIFIAVENMPSGSAYRPGDVVTAMDGTTIEIHNTDAEGRVTLADAIAYAKTLEPDMIIDIATLTGACIAALGDDIAGLFSNNVRLTERLKAASEKTGESIWEMPMPPQYMEFVKSPIADLKNVGKKGSAGSIAGAMFLKPFAGDTPWAHLDIAGPAYVERETRPDMPYGGTGFGVRLLTEFLERF
ncbi:leucyl aminopeptidase [Candidatus Uhrbacteria bacterium]|nr:leucyl aminopeptidase [Candidatus Uhrbacteria bacterium]